MITVKREKRSLKSETKYLEFNPVEWHSDFIHNFHNMYFGIDDRNLPLYQPGSTPKMTCITNISIFFLHDDSRERHYYLIGETEYAYFIFDVSTGVVKYLNHDEFLKTLNYAHKKYGGPQFVSSPGFYLNVKNMMYSLND